MEKASVTTQQPKSGSYFDGGLLDLFGWLLLGGILSSFTFGLFFPWTLCKIYGWQINHTVIEGKRLRFNGKAMGLFGKWIKWLLLCIITFGIYSFWLSVKLEQWKVENTSFE